MKVYIGPYRGWIGPYQIADKLMFWCKNGELRERFGAWLNTNKDGSESRLNKFCNWFYSKYERRVSVRIDSYDTWNADHTLALIIAPVLRQLKYDKCGVPATDREDCPADPIYDDKKSDDDWDLPYHTERWEYILGEMIYAFEMKIKKDEWDMEIYDKYGQQWTTEALDERNAIDLRIKNGLRLFGKYYNNLWT